MHKPLDDIIIVDMSRIMAGPWATQLLADLGATVIKIENPKRGDDTRFWGPPYIKNKFGDDIESAYFLSTNRGKYSVNIDIQEKEGQEIIYDLVKKSDIFIENFKVGNLKKYNLDYNHIKNYKEDIIYCSISGFGQNGPLKDNLGYDYMIQAMGGLMSITGEADEKNGEPMRVGIPIIDLMCGMYVANAIQAALIYKNKYAKGQYIDISLLDVACSMLANQSMNYLATNISPQRIGNKHPSIVPYQRFKCKDGNIIIAVGNDSQFKKLCHILNLEDVANNEKYLTNSSRINYQKELESIITAKLQTNDKIYWLNLLEKNHIPCGPINNIEELFANEQIKFRHMQQSVISKSGDNIPSVRSPIFSDKYEAFNSKAPPQHGEDTLNILKELLLYSDQKLDSLKKIIF